ncbi:hypothetical protein C8R43DRAFT_942375 [Mycena crocata]|nr:hypothetical protein C8R43DRAFT_942375 [Mycena crocata]
MILEWLSIPDRIQFGATCRTYTAIAARALRTAAALRLKRYNLSISDLRLLQSAKRCFVSGYVLKDLLYGDAEGKPRLPTKTSPPGPQTLDIYCSRNEGSDVCDFLHASTRTARLTYTGIPPALDGIRRSFTMVKPWENWEPVIRVFETNSDNSFDIIPKFPTTLEMGAWFLDRIWHAYPNISFQRLSLITPERLPVHHSEARQRTWEILHCTLHHGFWMHTVLPNRHRCGSSVNCPASCRSSNDRGCLTLHFNKAAWSSPFDEDPWQDHREVGWMFGAASFCDDWHIGKGASSRSYMHHEPRGRDCAVADKPRQHFTQRQNYFTILWPSKLIESKEEVDDQFENKESGGSYE